MAIATMHTRPPKEEVSTEELLTRWKQAARDLGIEAPRKKQEHCGRKEALRKLGKAFPVAIEDLTATSSTFAERDLVRKVCDHAQVAGASVEDVLSQVKLRLASSQVITLPRAVGAEQRYTTEEVLEKEKQLLRALIRAKEGKRPLVTKRRAERAVKGDSLSDEQKKAVLHITTGKKSVYCIDGLAGTGKSRVISASRHAFEASGYRVIGAAVCGKTALSLRETAGLSGSYTLAQVLYHLERTTVLGRVKENLNPLNIAGYVLRFGLRNKPFRYTEPVDRRSWLEKAFKKRDTPLFFDRKTVLVVDEASMLGTRAMERLLYHLERRGAKLVLIGDARQLPAIEAGAPFRLAKDVLGSATLEEIKRQEKEWERIAVSELAGGDVSKALSSYHEKKQLDIKETPREAIAGLIAAWKENGLSSPANSAIVAGTNAQVDELNGIAQKERRKGGFLSRKSFTKAGVTYHEGDRILITERDRDRGYENGHLGTVKRINRLTRRAVVQVDDVKPRFVIPFRHADAWKLGYAITAFKAQGMTVDRSFSLLSESSQRELAYVQLSRGRQVNHAFSFSSEESEEERLSEVKRNVARKIAKDNALDYYDQKTRNSLS